LRKNSVTFLNVVDNSWEAGLLMTQKYRASGVPLNYILDREGKVADAWYGGKETFPRALKALYKLGIGASNRTDAPQRPEN
jgi:hypothetical protein